MNFLCPTDHHMMNLDHLPCWQWQVVCCFVTCMKFSIVLGPFWLSSPRSLISSLEAIIPLITWRLRVIIWVKFTRSLDFVESLIRFQAWGLPTAEGCNEFPASWVSWVKGKMSSWDLAKVKLLIARRPRLKIQRQTFTVKAITNCRVSTMSNICLWNWNKQAHSGH
jgi:hypothetical protein